MMADGSVRVPIDQAEALERVARLRDEGCNAIAVCFLNSYVNPEHERILERLLAERAPELYSAISSRIAPHFREYDRLSTTVLSAYVGPKIRAYLSELRRRFADKQFGGNILVMGSNGGVLPPEGAIDHAATTCLSGPAGGVLAAVQIANELGIKNAISFDMGGTSTDVSLIQGGQAALSTRSEIAGLPISLAQIRIETVSAGGGSIASLDTGGLLHVGPDSAGSQPGPACYGFGGDRPTVTDAVFLMGLLRETKFFGGHMQLSRRAAQNAFKRLASRLAMSTEDAAEKAYRIATHKMANAVRLVSIREGHDPRDYALFAFGGAGPLHACAMAGELGSPRVIIPMYPGAFSAYGLLCADLRRDFVRSLVTPFAALDDDKLLMLLRELATSTRSEIADMGSKPRWMFQIDARYRGQAYEVAVDVVPKKPTISRVLSKFHTLHHRQFGFSDRDAQVELVNLRAIAVFERAKPRLPDLPASSYRAAELDRSRVFIGGEWREASYVSRDLLGRGDEGEGPLVIEENTATSYIPTGWRFTVTPAGHIDVRKK